MSIPGFTAEAALSSIAVPYLGDFCPPVEGEVIPQGWGCVLCSIGCGLCLANPELIPICIEPCILCVAEYC